MASVAVLGGGLALGGCSGWSSDSSMRGSALLEPTNLAAAQTAAPQNPTNFTQGLAAEYAAFATTLSHTPSTGQTGDWVDTDFFARKSMKAGDGFAVPPERNANWQVPLEVPEEFRMMLSSGRARLVTALDDGGRDRAPLLAARAQERYDCWVEQMQADWSSDMAAACRRDFTVALDEMERRPVPVAAAQPASGSSAARQYQTFFAFDKSSLTPEGRQTIDSVAASLRDDATLRIQLVGKTDLVGTDAYNLALSERRTDTVRTALRIQGIAADRVDQRSVGEREPPVPTAQGTREPLNRVVEVTLH
jgi:OOP family OmpA-OmpF porin